MPLKLHVHLTSIRYFDATSDLSIQTFFLHNTDHCDDHPGPPAPQQKKRSVGPLQSLFGEMARRKPSSQHGYGKGPQKKDRTAAGGTNPGSGAGSGDSAGGLAVKMVRKHLSLSHTHTPLACTRATAPAGTRATDPACTRATAPACTRATAPAGTERPHQHALD
jgi:hypothetical protein